MCLLFGLLNVIPCPLTKKKKEFGAIQGKIVMTNVSP